MYVLHNKSQYPLSVFQCCKSQQPHDRSIMAPYIMDGVALITGSASGIGRACALAFADEGVTRLVLADVNITGLEETSNLLKKMNPEVQTVVIKTDTSSEQEVQNMVDAGVKKFGSIHYAVNCAGVTSVPRAKTADLSVESWDRVQNINLRGVWLCQRAVIRQMLRQEYLKPEQMRSGAAPERGSIVNISSVLGRVAHPTNGSVSVRLSEEVLTDDVLVCSSKTRCSWPIQNRCRCIRR